MGDHCHPGWNKSNPVLSQKETAAMNQVEIDGKKYFTPSDWNELTKKQVLFVSRLFQGQLTLMDFKLRVLLKFLTIRQKVMKRIDHEDVYFLCESLDFLFKEVSLTINLLPVLRTGRRKYYGPADAMMSGLIKIENLKELIIEIREQSVLLDSTVAEIYEVEVKRINEAVKNNPEKFPAGYVIELEKTDWDLLKSKFSTSIKGGKVKRPSAVTEKGLYKPYRTH